MIAYYELIDALQTHLQADSEINTVLTEGVDKVDLDKRSIFGLAHIGVTGGEFLMGSVQFNISIAVMDIVDEDKTGIEKLPGDERWKGVSNRQDILNNMLSVLERLEKAIRNDNLKHDGIDMVGNMTVEPFEERFENLLTGWEADFTFTIPNTVQSC